MGFWKKLGDTILAVATFLNVNKEVCYKDAGIGCFSNADPFDNAAGKLPQSPADISVRFLLYTRHNPLVAQRLRPSRAPLITSHYDGSQKTKIIIHGFRDDGLETWIQRMTAAILKKEDVNVIVVDWEKGADGADYSQAAANTRAEDANVIVVDWEKGSDGADYSQAAANTRAVGALIANIIKSLALHCKTRMKDIHLIGHSLGAHVAGYTGSRIPGTGRITGLDPAGFHFDDQDVRVRLDPKDALFVDVIHTDGEPITTLGFGSRIPMGDVDFFPNGGKDQPGCKQLGGVLTNMFKGGFKALTRGVGCSHARAKDLFTESISGSCVFKAYPCSSYKNFQADRCPCKGKCIAMGYQTKTNVTSGKYYLSTNDKTPYCKNK